jgi:uracil-DNA glycosylase
MYEPVAWASKCGRLCSEEKMKPLLELVKELEEISDGRNVPNFDPDDGGVDAEALLLFQDPGPKVGTAKKLGTGFISEDNPDQTALRVKNIKKSTGLNRTRTLAWNAVPWEIEKKERDSEFARVKREKCLTKLLKKLKGHKLKAVALFGLYAQEFEGEVREADPDLRIFKTWHPGPQPMRRWPEKRREFEKTFQEIKDYLDNKK